MRTKFILIFIALFYYGGMQEISAQKWLKSLGKIADQILSTGIPNVNLNVTKCEYWGDDVALRFTVTNVSSKDLELWFSDELAGGKTSAYDNNNNKYEVDIYLGNKGNIIVLPTNIPVKGCAMIRKVPRGTQSLRQVVLTGKSGGETFDYKIGSQTITYAKNTNKSNIFCSLPILTYNMNKCYRNGNNIIIEGTAINNDNKQINLYSSDGSVVYDVEGNRYDLFCEYASETYQGAFLENGIPMRVSFTIKDVPASISQFSLAKYSFRCDGNYYIEIRNLQVQ